MSPVQVLELSSHPRSGCSAPAVPGGQIPGYMALQPGSQIPAPVPSSSLPCCAVDHWMDFTFDPIDFPLEEMQVGAWRKGGGDETSLDSGDDQCMGWVLDKPDPTWCHSPVPASVQNPMQKLVHDLHANGQKFVPILDPGIKVSPGYHAYDVALAQDLFVKNAEGDPYLGWVSVGWCLEDVQSPTAVGAGPGMHSSFGTVWGSRHAMPASRKEGRGPAQDPRLFHAFPLSGGEPCRTGQGWSAFRQGIVADAGRCSAVQHRAHRCRCGLGHVTSWTICSLARRLTGWNSFMPTTSCCPGTASG